MPITKQTLSQSLIGAINAVQLNGVKVPDLSKGIAQGVNSFLPSITVSTSHTGLVGSGTGVGSVTLDIGTGTQDILSQFQAQGIQGVKAPNLAGGIATGVGQEFNANSQVQVTITGTGPGSGVGSLTAMSSSLLFSTLMQGFNAHMEVGSKADDLARALSQALVTWFGKGVVNTTDGGFAVTPPVQGGGVGTGSIF